MELTKLIDYIPAIIVLVAVMILIIFVFKTQGDKIFDKESKTQNILIFIGGSLFIIVLIVHLFREQPWTADILKILIGILVGGSSANIVSRNTSGNSIDISGNANGDVAGRDINKNIQNIKEGISDIRDSVIHQNNQIKQLVTENNDYDYLITIIFEINREEFCKKFKEIINLNQRERWVLKQIVSEYEKYDGMFLFFTREKQENQEANVYYQDSKKPQTKNGEISYITI
jgi:hypothetical protein